MWQWRFLRYFPFMDFFCTFFKGMSICIKNCTNVLRKYNRTDHTCWKTWSMVFQCQHSLGVPRKQLHNGRKFYYESDVKKNIQKIDTNVLESNTDGPTSHTLLLRGVQAKLAQITPCQRTVSSPISPTVLR